MQQDSMKRYGAESAFENESQAESHGPRQTPSAASSLGQDKEKSRRPSLIKKIAQLEAANQVWKVLLWLMSDLIPVPLGGAFRPNQDA